MERSIFWMGYLSLAVMRLLERSLWRFWTRGCEEAEEFAGEDLVDSPIGNIGDMVRALKDSDGAGGRVALEEDEIGVLRGLGEGGAMGSDDELGSGKGFGRMIHELSLPGGVQVQIDLVDEDDGRLGEGVSGLGVAGHHACDGVDEPGDGAAVPEAEAAEIDPPVAVFEEDDGKVLPGIAVNFYVGDFWERVDEQALGEFQFGLSFAAGAGVQGKGRGSEGAS